MVLLQVLPILLLGVFSALQFAVSVMTDTEIQATYFAGVRQDARQVLAVRARYRSFLDQQDVAHLAGPDATS